MIVDHSLADAQEDCEKADDVGGEEENELLIDDVSLLF